MKRISHSIREIFTKGRARGSALARGRNSLLQKLHTFRIDTTIPPGLRRGECSAGNGNGVKAIPELPGNRLSPPWIRSCIPAARFSGIGSFDGGGGA